MKRKFIRKNINKNYILNRFFKAKIYILTLSFYCRQPIIFEIKSIFIFFNNEIFFVKITNFFYDN